ncbi:MAG: hypothetical protein AAGF12_04165 [Myxococcota bacterium]
MVSTYAETRRQHRAIDTERDLRQLWRSERFVDARSIEDALRIYEMAIRVDGWSTVIGWARDALSKRAILNTQLVELAMRSLEQRDDGFFGEITDHLRAHSPANYFEFWFSLFVARHSHRGERLFRKQLESVSDFHIVKYRRWVRRIFRKLRFRCKTDRERAIGAVAFGVLKNYDPKAYASEVFEQFIAASNAARTRPQTAKAKPVSGARHAQVFAAAAAPLRMWSIAEGLRTSARIPRTLEYLSVMAPTLSDVELLRALKAFDGKLLTADHKKASELVTKTAAHLTERLSAMKLTPEEWAKILPYQQSPVVSRVVEDVLGKQLDGIVETHRSLPIRAIPVLGPGLDARGFRAAFITAYALQRADRESIAYRVAVDGQVHALAHDTPLWPMGVGKAVPVERYRPEADHPHRVGFNLVRATFPEAAQVESPQPRPVRSLVHALRAHLYRRAVVHREVLARDIPVLFLSAPPTDEERAGLLAMLSMFAGAALVLMERSWEVKLPGNHLVHVEAPKTSKGLLTSLTEAARQLRADLDPYRARKAELDRAVRALLLGPAPAAIVHVTR